MNPRATRPCSRSCGSTSMTWVIGIAKPIFDACALMAVVIPTTVYVFVLPYTGIYIASMVLIAGFMIWLGKYRWPMALAVGVAVPIAIYFMFEKWFLVPLPKGPIEYALGL